MRVRYVLFVAGVCLVAFRPAGAVQPTDPGGGVVEPATRPAAVDPAVGDLVTQLGDTDPAAREEATRKLTKIGKPALPALRQAAEGDDPEAKSRAKALIRHIERHLPPPGPAPQGNARSQSVRVTVNQGVKTVEVNDNGRKLHITRAPDGSIEMAVTGEEDGKEVTETYKAADADELKRDSPEAFALYDQWAGGDGSAWVIHGGGAARAGVRIGPGLPGGAQPQMPALPPVPPPDLKGMRDLIEQQLNDANVPPEQRARVLDQLQAMEKQRQQTDERMQRVHDRLRGAAAEAAGQPATIPATQPSR